LSLDIFFVFVSISNDLIFLIDDELLIKIVK